MGDAYESVTVDIENDVAQVTLVGPGKGNAMGPAFWAEMPEVFAKLDADRDVHAIVLTGSGKNFSYGVDLISAVDIRYASADAKFSVREVKLAIVADVGSLARLPLILNDGHLRELALTGKDIDAARAEKIGLVNDVYDGAEASLAAAHETAAEIAANPPLVVNGVKDVLDQQRIARVSESLRYVAAWNAAFLPSKDLTEGLTATFEKRQPEFTGE